MNSHSRTLGIAILLFAAFACSKDESKTPRRQLAVPQARKDADEVFRTICVTCHGDSGHGDGPGAAACDPKPRTFADAAWQASVTDDHIVKTITLGGAAVGKNPQMPAQPQLKGKTELLQQLVTIIRGFAAK